ncbi:winged helix-turn-helix domain-containing protein [Rahnella sikkimica]|uniref:CadC family transcriptional regulator n=1 Tax=Rahnella sikkimica TaxID=1805933 RepID=A0A2L1UTA6_9GAMM|nr:winged helix-turn-helix domain-containing protein [Rahnella sikkimica]AVF36114.1 CadC family transcriptional regulator [Rahnella sikkimica]
MQMIYLIENEIVFNPEDNSLSLLSDAESKAVVSNPARRILLLLIEQHGIVVHRETFFKKVWDDYGLTASNNNLNHCISKLRKVISLLGYSDEFIVTVPKVGFFIRKEIAIEVNFEQIAIHKESTEEHKPVSEIAEIMQPVKEGKPSAEIIAEPVHPEKVPHKQRRWEAKHTIFMSILVMAAIIVLGIFILYHELSDPKAHLLITKIGPCDLYSTAPVTPSRKDEFTRLAEIYLRKNNISCKQGEILIFQSERFSLPINTGSVRDFMTQCNTDDNHKMNICISYYTNDRTTHDKL